LTKTQFTIRKVGKKYYIYKNVSNRLGPFASKDEAEKMVEALKIGENPLNSMEIQYGL